MKKTIAPIHLPDPSKKVFTDLKAPLMLWFKTDYGMEGGGIKDVFEASLLYRQIIEEKNLGASEADFGKVVDRATKKTVAVISYNGKINLP